MSPIIITLALYLVGILGGFVIGYEVAHKRFKKTMANWRREILIHYTNRLHMIHALKDQLSKFHQLRGKNGRFISSEKANKK